MKMKKTGVNIATSFFKKNIYFCIKTLIMTIIIKKRAGKKKLDEVLKNIKHSKKLNAKRHLGKVKWDEDALEYQQKLRNEWD